MEKKFKTIDEQIEILKSKGLTINNIEHATDILINNNYYYLINGYKDLFIDKNYNEEKFINGTTLEEIYMLYEFDRAIRIIFLEYILLIERRIDSYISYEFSKQYGHKNYLISNNFNYTNKTGNNIDKFIDTIHLEIIHQYKNSNKMIKHYLDTYNYLPLWVLIRILSFGKVSKFYSFMKPKEQNNVSKKFNLKSYILRIYLTNLAETRNICAHDEKLYDINLRFKIAANKYHSLLKINKSKGNYISGVKDLFSIVLILKSLLTKDEFIKFYKTLIQCIENLNKDIKSINFQKILNKMGFPKNYKKLLKL